MDPSGTDPVVDPTAEAGALERRLPALRRIARRLEVPAGELDDLVQEGCIGWIRAARTTSSTDRMQFGVRTIEAARRAMGQAAARRQRTVQHLRLGYPPPPPESRHPLSSAHLDPTLSDYRTLSETGDLAGPLVYRIEDEIIEAVDRGALRDRVVEALATLSPRSRQIVRLRSGLYDEPPLSRREVARSVGLTSERIRQLEAEAIARLRVLLAPAEQAAVADAVTTPVPARPLRRGPSGERLIAALADGVTRSSPPGIRGWCRGGAPACPPSLVSTAEAR
jgi:RNA polymerase sigma factor (sigma-70 family)